MVSVLLVTWRKGSGHQSPSQRYVPPDSLIYAGAIDLVERSVAEGRMTQVQADVTLGKLRDRFEA